MTTEVVLRGVAMQTIPAGSLIVLDPSNGHVRLEGSDLKTLEDKCGGCGQIDIGAMCAICGGDE